MAYTHVTSTRNGAEAIQYARGDGHGHNQNEKRNQYVSGVNMLPDEIVPFEQQMQPYWDRAGSRNKNQVRRIVQSFSREELDPDKPEDVLTAHRIGIELAQALYPGYQVIVFTQTDGKSGLIHNHLIVCNVHMETYKGVPHEKVWHSTIEQASDRICQQHFDLASPDKAAEKVNQVLRTKRAKQAAAIERRNALLAEGKTEEAAEVVVEYIWQDDLRRRIREAAAAATDEESFLRELTARGVEGTRRKATKKQPEYYLYELTDTTGFPDLAGIPQNLKSKSYKMGEDYQPEGVRKQFRQGVFEATAPVAAQRPVEAPQTHGTVPGGISAHEDVKPRQRASEARRAETAEDLLTPDAYSSRYSPRGFDTSPARPDRPKRTGKIQPGQTKTGMERKEDPAEVERRESAARKREAEERRRRERIAALKDDPAFGFPGAQDEDGPKSRNF